MLIQQELHREYHEDGESDAKKIKKYGWLKRGDIEIEKLKKTTGDRGKEGNRTDNRD